jgi:hypothetical protein
MSHHTPPAPRDKRGRRPDSGTFTPVPPLPERAVYDASMAELADRLLPLLTPCSRMRGLTPDAVDWSAAAELLLILTQAELRLSLRPLIHLMGADAADVLEALLGILRASVNPRAGSPVIREQAFRCLCSWSRELRQAI